jgi:hypothetical protein
VEDLVDRALDGQALAHVVLDEREALVVQEVLDVDLSAGHEAVDRDDLVASSEQRIAEVRTQEPGPAGDDRPGHQARPMAR